METKHTIFDYEGREVLAKALEVLVNSQELMEVYADRAGAGDPTRERVAQYALALNAETIEYANELGWKDWKLPRPVDPSRVIDEFADMLAFLGILVNYGMRATGRSAMSFAEGYRDKTEVNVARINEGRVQGYGGHKFHPDKLVEPGPGSLYREALSHADDDK